MSKSTRLHLLFFTTLTVFLLSFAFDSRSESCCSYTKNSPVKYFPASATGLEEADNLGLQESAVFHHHLKYVNGENKQVKYKKKFKRTSHVFPDVKSPVKDIEPELFNISTGLYSKPYFLSHLHRFLFRLTPF